MITRKKHPNKDIEKCITSAGIQGWRYQKVGNSSHAWGRLLCPFSQRGGCAISIWSTPRNVEQHIKQIEQRMKQCDHSGDNDGNK